MSNQSSISEVIRILDTKQITESNGFSDETIKLSLNTFFSSLTILENPSSDTELMADHIEAVSKSLYILKSSTNYNYSTFSQIMEKYHTFIVKLIELQKYSLASVECWKALNYLKDQQNTSKKPSPFLKNDTLDVDLNHPNHKLIIYGQLDFTNEEHIFHYLNIMILYLQTIYISYKFSNKLIGSEDLLRLLDVNNSNFLKVLSQQSMSLKIQSFKIMIKILNSFIQLQSLPRILKCLVILKSCQIIVRNKEIIDKFSDLPTNKWLEKLSKMGILKNNSEPLKVYKYLNKDFYLLLEEYGIGEYLSKTTLADLLHDFKNIKVSFKAMDTCNWEKYSVIYQLNPTNDNVVLKSIINSGEVTQLDIENYCHFSVTELSSNQLLKQLSISTSKIIKNYSISTQICFIETILKNMNDYFDDTTNSQLKRSHLNILDTITVHSKNLIDTLPENYEFILSSLAILAEVYKKCGQTKRFRNISNLYYNIGLKFIKLNDENSSILIVENLLKCIKIEHIICLSELNDENIKQYESKVQKAVTIFLKSKKVKLASLIVCEFLNLAMSKFDSFFSQLHHIETNFNTTLRLLLKCIIIPITSSEGKDLSFDFLSHGSQTVIFISLLNLTKLICPQKTSEVFEFLWSHLKLDKNDGLLYKFCYIECRNLIDIPKIEVENNNTSVLEDYRLLIDTFYKFKIFTKEKDDSPEKLVEIVKEFSSWLNNSSIDNNVLRFEFKHFQTMVFYYKYHALDVYLSELISDYSKSRYEYLANNKEEMIWIMLESIHSYQNLGFSQIIYKNLKFLEKYLHDNKSDSSPINFFLMNIAKLEYFISRNDLENSKAIIVFTLSYMESNSEIFPDSIFKFIENQNITSDDVNMFFHLSNFSYLVSKFKFQSGIFGNSVFDLRRAVRMILIISRKLSQGKLSMINNENYLWQCTSLLFKFYMFFMEINLHYGFSKDCEFYIKELSKLVFEDKNNANLQIIQLRVCFLVIRFAILANKKNVLDKYYSLSQDLYKKLKPWVGDKKLDVLNCLSVIRYTFFCSPNDNFKVQKEYFELTKIIEELGNFIGKEDDNIYNNLSKADLEIYQEMKLSTDNLIMSKFNNENLDKINYLDAFESFATKTLKFPIDYVVSAKQHLLSAKKYLASDPVLAILQDSAISIPSLLSNMFMNENSKVVTKSIQELVKSRDLILSNNDKSKIIWKSSTSELYELSYVFNYSLSLLSAIAKLSINNSSFNYNDILAKLVSFNELPRELPFYYEKKISSFMEKTSRVIPDMDFDKIDIEINLQEEVQKFLPENWEVITLDFCPFTGDLLLSKINKLHSASELIVRLPLNRFSSRDFNNDSISFKDAKEEFLKIIEQNNESTKFSKNNKIIDMEAKKHWWKSRYKLNAKLEKLLHDIEFFWLGGFKGIFSPQIIPKNVLKAFKRKFIVILEQNLPSRKNQRRKKSRSLQRSVSVPSIVHAQYRQMTELDSAVDDSIIELFFKLGDVTKLEETEILEDLIYFVLDILSFHGEENAYDEIDIDQIYVDVEGLLNDYYKSFDTNLRISHTVLIVGKTCQNLPWESLPCLLDCSVSRMPSLKLLLNSLKRYDATKRLEFNISNPGYYILNPGKDLMRTQEVFEKKFLDYLPNWSKTVNESPTEQEFLSGVANSDLFIYIGHGGGEHYVRNSRLKKLPGERNKSAAAALLLGCSSGSLSDNGQLEPNGTVFSYLIADSPMIVANLWDVTDKDIDKFSVSVFEKWGVFDDDNYGKLNICESVAQSRKTCLLKHLNGAAPVVYGLPFYINKKTKVLTNL